jgi:Fic family protein
MIVSEGDDRQLFDRIQELNLLRQYDLLANCIEIGLKQGHTALDKYTLWSLNHVAVANISQFGGRFRKEPIYVGNHIPPHFREVPELMDRFISTIHENWFNWTATELAAYGLWRLNWIHPFIEGNGRTARAVCYYLMCVRSGILLRGRKIVPERIRETRPRYVAGLRAADQAWEAGQLDFSEMESYLADLLQDQLQNVGLPPQPPAQNPAPQRPGLWVPPKPKQAPPHSN